MRDRFRAVIALGVALLCVVVGVSSHVQPSIQFTGVTLRNEPTGLVIDTVDVASRAAGLLAPDMKVISINGVPADEFDLEELDRYMSGDFLAIEVEGEEGLPVEMTFPLEAESVARFFFVIALGLLIGIAAWVGRGFAGNALRPLAVPFATAAAAPMLLSPVWDTGDPDGIAAAIVLPALGSLVLADGFVARITIPRARRVAVAVALAGSVVAPAAVLLVVLNERPRMLLAELAFLVNLANAVMIGVTLVTAAAIAVSTSRLDPEQSGTHRLDRLPILVAAVTPIVTAASVSYLPLGFGIGVPLIWLLVVVVMLQANARFEILRLQRDTVVAATEAERARLAADLHDDALQEMTVLIRRLDDKGSKADAEIARSVADRLRDVCGDLRLPILDELGAGPALEWLVERVSQTSGGEIRLERADIARPPADVELAFFRIAQEALSNAVNHGSPPIQVEYRASTDEAALSITDNGSGLPPDSAAVAPRSGHYGLLNMRQRAEQIGASIEFGRGSGGGTSVGLRWAQA